MNRLVLNDELEASADKILDKAECDAIVMKKPSFEAIRDVEHASAVIDFISHPGKTQFACIKKMCSLPADAWILVTNIPKETEKSGKPGTGCGTGKVSFADGLCYIPETTLKPVESLGTTTVESSSSPISILITVIFVVVFIQ